MRQPLLRSFCLCLGLGVAMVAGGACSPEASCFADSECGNEKICRRGKCVRGSRGGDAGVDDDGGASDLDWPQVGDPINSDFGSPADPTPLGPSVDIISPVPYELVRDIFVIKAVVVDFDGIPPGEVTAIIAERFFIPLGPLVGPPENLFGAAFDARQIPYMAFPSLVVTANDIYGNEGHDGIEFSLDREPPLVALDSPEMVYAKVGLTDLLECSRPFNPLGSAHVRHGDIINIDYVWGVGFYPRVRIEDQANTTYGRYPAVYSGVDNTTTFLYLLDSDALAAGHRLFLGNGPGTRCDRLDPSMLPDAAQPTTDQAIVQRLIPAGLVETCPSLPYPFPWGRADFTQRPLEPLVAPCESNGVDLYCADLLGSQCYKPPEALCLSSEGITIWIGRDGAMPNSCGDRIPPAIYVLNDFNSRDRDFACSGGPFDPINHTSNGPACIGAIATDNFGNQGFSPPIVVCIDKNNSGVCAGFVPPDPFTFCNDGCTAPQFLGDHDSGTKQLRPWPFNIIYGG